MLYTDRSYGKVEITEPVLLELINSPSLQRLKNIDQIGYPEPFFPGASHSRFEHSMGVFILLQKYKAPLEEQIAGLIHDVSHSAFSHCIDYILDEGSEKKHDHQDNIFKKFVLNSEIPQILKKYKFEPDYILDDKNFPLKETLLPDLCADRIDYSIRTAFIFKEIGKKDINYFFNNLALGHPPCVRALTQGDMQPLHWIFKNLESAKQYADLFTKLNTVYYSGFLSALMFKTVGDCLKYVLQKKYITEKDLYATDNFILNKIQKHLSSDSYQDNKLKLLWDRMNNKVRYSLDENRSGNHVYIKSRAVDPLCKYKGLIKRYSDIRTYWKKIIEQEMKPKEYFIKFEELDIRY